MLFGCMALKHAVVPLLCQSPCCFYMNPPTKQYLITGDPVLIPFYEKIGTTPHSIRAYNRTAGVA